MQNPEIFTEKKRTSQQDVLVSGALESGES
jgi:hypothetical protein